jgi:hypothetical protein
MGTERFHHSGSDLWSEFGMADVVCYYQSTWFEVGQAVRQNLEGEVFEVRSIRFASTQD